MRVQQWTLVLCACVFVVVSGARKGVKVKVPLVQEYENGSLPTNKPISSQIISGAAAPLGMFPWQASIRITRFGNAFYCGGSIIHELWVMSAGHCTKSSSRFEIRLGSINPTSGGILVNTTTSYTHFLFSSYNLNNDIGLIKLQAPITFTKNIQPIRIALQDLSSSPQLTVSGWGKTADGVSGVSPRLMFVSVRAISNNECSDIFGTDIVTSNSLCTVGNPTHGPCQGDSGGPLTAMGPTPYLVALVSFTASSGCETGYPSGFIRVLNFRSWINSVTNLSL